MGLRIVIKGADFSKTAVGYASPVQDGLEYLNFFGGASPLSRNLAIGKPPVTVVGAPVVGDNSATFTQLVNYLQTGVADTHSKTIMMVARSPNPKGNGVGVSNYNSQRLNGGGAQITAATSLLFRSSADPDAGETGESFISSSWDGSTQASVGSGSAQILNRPLGGITTLVGRTNGGGGVLAGAKSRRIDNKTFGLTVTLAEAANRMMDLGQPYRVGSGYTSIDPAVPQEILFAAIWSRELTDVEVDAMFAAIKPYYAKRGITI